MHITGSCSLPMLHVNRHAFLWHRHFLVRSALLFFLFRFDFCALAKCLCSTSVFLWDCCSEREMLLNELCTLSKALPEVPA
jgi:hypothetical protein